MFYYFLFNSTELQKAQLRRRDKEGREPDHGRRSRAEQLSCFDRSFFRHIDPVGNIAFEKCE